MRRASVLPVLLLAIACSAGTTAAGAGGSAQPTRGGANVINSAEIEAAPPDAQTAYDLVSRLRPMMLRPRNQTAGQSNGEFGVMVFVEDVRLGEIDQLRTVMRATVAEIRYINATDATTRWGTGYSNGVIQVRLKR